MTKYVPNKLVLGLFVLNLQFFYLYIYLRFVVSCCFRRGKLLKDFWVILSSFTLAFIVLQRVWCADVEKIHMGVRTWGARGLQPPPILAVQFFRQKFGQKGFLKKIFSASTMARRLMYVKPWLPDANHRAVSKPLSTNTRKANRVLAYSRVASPHQHILYVHLYYLSLSFSSAEMTRTYSVHSVTSVTVTRQMKKASLE